MLQGNQTLQVSGAGGPSGTKRIPYLLSVSKDHPKGEEPTTIKDNSKDYIKFKEALDLVKDEKQVLILVDNMISREGFYEQIAKKLPMNSYTEHHRYKTDNDGAAAWVEHHLTRQEEDAINKKFKFLIGDWWTTAGYEVPAVIFVTDDLTNVTMATCVQRAKAKLIMYSNSSISSSIRKKFFK